MKYHKHNLCGILGDAAWNLGVSILILVKKIISLSLHNYDKVKNDELKR